MPQKWTGGKILVYTQIGVHPDYRKEALPQREVMAHCRDEIVSSMP
jgi:hypothetical protein